MKRTIFSVLSKSYFSESRKLDSTFDGEHKAGNYEV